MKVLLYCAQSYSIAILTPLGEEANRRGYEVLWYCPLRFANKAPAGARCVSTHREAYEFRSDVIFVPGNDVPFYFRGVKVQVFHGFAGEKKGHFRIRGYFDLYLTQGPYFTERFLELSEKHRNFEVVETGWPKLDPYFKQARHVNRGAKPILLYAPTFSPRLSSALNLVDTIPILAKSFEVVIKFHPLTSREILDVYNHKCKFLSSVSFSDCEDVCSLINSASVVLSDTSSVVYEAIMLGRGVVTYKSASFGRLWSDVDCSEDVLPACVAAISNRHEGMAYLRQRYHPYEDGMSAPRMLDATESYALRKGIPTVRVVSFARKIRYAQDWRLWL